MSEPLSFLDENGEEIFAPEGCDGLCRLDCEVHDPEHEYCNEQVYEPIEPEARLAENVARLDDEVED